MLKGALAGLLPPTQDGRLLAIDTPLGKDVFLLEEMRGMEALSTLFQFDLRVRSLREDVAAEELLGQRIGFSLELPSSPGTVERRYWSGFVADLSAEDSVARGQRFYSLTVRPWLWFLTANADCRIFQGRDSLEIMEQIFNALGFRDYDFSRVINRPPKREYCVQYRETDFNFISRLIEEDGLFYYFVQEEERHVLVVADGIHGYREGDPPVLRYSQTDVDLNKVGSWERHWRFVTGRATHADYNFETPDARLVASSPSLAGLEMNEGFELFDWHGRFAEQAAGERTAKRSMAQFEADFETITGQSDSRSIAPGFRYSLEGHLAEVENGREFVILAVEHWASDQSYETGGGRPAPRYFNQFRAVPGEVPYVTPGLTLTPRVDGIQKAVVVGPEGEEIHTDRWLQVWLEANGFSVAEQRRLAGVTGADADVLARRVEEGEAFVYRLRTYKNGNLLFLVAGKAAHSAYPDMEEALFVASESFRLETERVAPYAEPVETFSATAPLRTSFEMPAAWRQTQEANEGQASFNFDNVATGDLVVGKINVTIAAPERFSTHQAVAETLLDAVRRGLGLPVTAVSLREVRSLDPAAAVQVGETLVDRAGAAVRLQVTVVRRTEGWVSFLLVGNVPDPDPMLVDAINRRAYEVAVQSFRIEQ